MHVFSFIYVVASIVQRATNAIEYVTRCNGRYVDVSYPFLFVFVYRWWCRNGVTYYCMRYMGMSIRPPPCGSPQRQPPPPPGCLRHGGHSRTKVACSTTYCSSAARAAHHPAESNAFKKEQTDQAAGSKVRTRKKGKAKDKKLRITNTSTAEGIILGAKIKHSYPFGNYATSCTVALRKKQNWNWNSNKKRSKTRKTRPSSQLKIKHQVQLKHINQKPNEWKKCPFNSTKTTKHWKQHKNKNKNKNVDKAINVSCLIIPLF